MPRPQRFRLAWPLWVRLKRHFGQESRGKPEEVVAVETITENISTTGCYFYVSADVEEPAVGSPAEMEITVPGNSLGLGNSTVHCHGKVIRVDLPSAGGKVGVACSIDSYAFHPPKPKPHKIQPASG